MYCSQAAMPLRYAGNRPVRSALPIRAPSTRSRAATVSVAAGKATVPLTIEIKQEVSFGEVMKACGNDAAFGSWALDKAPALKWSEGHVWKLTTDIPVGQTMKFKLVRVKEDGANWEGGGDRELKALGPDYGLSVTCSWDKTSDMVVEASKLGAGGGASAGSKSNASVVSGDEDASKKAKQQRGAVAVAERSGDGSSGLSSFEEESRGAGKAWVGASPEFVQSRQDKERSGVWNTDGLDGVGLAVVEGDKGAANWLKKLVLVKELLVDRNPMMRPGLEELAYCFVYTTWINSGAITCTEAGSHFRPNHHAEAAMKIFRSLEWVIGDGSHSMYAPASVAAHESALAVMAARRMHGRLPSISGEFRQSVPLTRIRDIAHRGDIPHDLKQEIKHTLQNKLHRCAGPEDLIASERMLQKITAKQGEYNDGFVNEFKIFIRELREFFNASGLEDVLAKTADVLDEAHGSAVGQLLSAKRKVESNNKPLLEDLMALLFSATQVRTFYAAGLQAGLRNDIGDDVLEMRQRWRLCEVRLEEYCFVVLSRIVNVLEEQGGAQTLSTAANTVWALPLSALTAGLRNLGLSQYKAKELLALENELQAWHAAAPLVSSKDTALRAKASLDRILRLSAEYSDALMGVYAIPAAALGKALGVPPHMATVFGEAEVRSSVAFQVSKLAALLTKALRLAAGLSAWDGLVTGDVVGTLVEVDRLSPDTMAELSAKHGGKPLILLTREADGDEELGPLVPLGLRGVVLRQELPHLSHLGVRARQENVVFATNDDEDSVKSDVKPLLGLTVTLSVAPGCVTLKEGGDAASNSSAPSAAKESTSDEWSGGERVSSATMLKMADVTDANCGAKAGKCAELEHLAANSSGLFAVPTGCALPYGNMDVAIAAAGGKVATEYAALLKELEDPKLSGAALDAACDSMQALVSAVAPSDSLVKQISAAFPAHALLAVRSSANVEDLAGMSAAGLYESVVGVPAGDAQKVAAAVSAVWASLYTRRAVLSRRIAGVPHSSASMAVLVQELHVPKVSFVLHTARPSDMNTGVLLIEAAPGQGETLAAATAGTPWRLEVEKAAGGRVDTLAFANFSCALQVSASHPEKGLAEQEVDYSKQRLSVDSEYRMAFGQKLAAVGCAIEAYFAKVPQDIEGGLIATDSDDTRVLIFQSRPQH
ncbi:hypothetical protein FOA52_004892 [Chlamydomonas sp. UWO 241]|nr:hypothetical protein FOA52_004892 [Chlamydomonas sp. UWO 241]